MKLKYYLRGLGIGILVTTIIFMIFIRVDKDQLLNEKEIIAKAEDLGMVMQEDNEDGKTLDQLKENDTDKENSDKENSDQKEESTENQDTDSTQNTDNTTVEQVEFHILPGEYSDTISQKLADAGLVDDKEAFNEFIINSDYDNLIQTGDFVIPKGSSYEDIAKILTTR